MMDYPVIPFFVRLDAKRREINRVGRLAHVGNTVDAKNATGTNPIGATEPIPIWKDPDFDADIAAFYLCPCP